MRPIVSDFLRKVLFADAVISGATGLLLALGAAPLTGLLGLPEALMRWAGVSLLPFAVLVASIGRRERVPRPAVWAVVLYNVLWVVDSLLILALRWVEPTLLGSAFVVAQALAVAGFAALQYLGLRRSPALA